MINFKNYSISSLKLISNAVQILKSVPMVVFISPRSILPIWLTGILAS